MKFRRKLVTSQIATMILFAAVISAGSLVFLRVIIPKMEKAIADKSSACAAGVSATADVGIAADDHTVLQKSLQTCSLSAGEPDPDFRFAAVVGRGNRLLASTGDVPEKLPSPPPGGTMAVWELDNAYRAGVRVAIEGMELGSVWAEYHTKEVANVKIILLVSNLVGLLILLASAALSILYALHLVRPLREMISHVHTVACGEFSTRLSVKAGDELGMLVKDLNHMTQELQHRHDLEVGVFLASKLFFTRNESDSHKAIEALARTVAADWAYVIRLGDDGGSVSVAAMWAPPDKRTGLKSSLEKANAADFSWSMSRLKRGESAVIPDVDDLPDQASIQKEVFRSRGVGAALQVPVRSQSGALLGTLVFCAKKKRSRWLQSDIQAIGVITELLGAFWERERAEKESKEMDEKVRQLQKMEAVGRLAGGVAHEINNPLGVILGFAQSVSKRIKSDDPLSMPLKSIEQQTLRCKTLVSDLLAFSRKSTEEFAPVNLCKLIESTRTLVENQAKLGRIDMDIRCRPDLPEIGADANHLQQVLVNLATNAIDAMPNGGVLTIEASANGSGVVLKVSDTGGGMSPEVQEHVFEPFFTTKDVGKGTGLGLSLAYEIVGQHRGTIECDSEPGKGAAFTIRLPIR